MSQIGTTSEGVPVILLKEGTRQSRGKDAQRNNIRATKLISEIIQTSLVPRGMDKMLVGISKFSCFRRYCIGNILQYSYSGKKIHAEENESRN